MELQQQALAIKRELGDEIEIAKTLSNMGLVEDARGDCGKALGLYAQSLDIFVRQNKPQFAASVLNNQGLCYDALGDFRRSTATYQRALALHREQGNETGETSALGNLGGVRCYWAAMTRPSRSMNSHWPSAPGWTTSSRWRSTSSTLAWRDSARATSRLLGQPGTCARHRPGCRTVA
jgi:tetratricopeptide (TPR) repeat protein